MDNELQKEVKKVIEKFVLDTKDLKPRLNGEIDFDNGQFSSEDSLLLFDYMIKMAGLYIKLFNIPSVLEKPEDIIKNRYSNVR